MIQRFFTSSEEKHSVKLTIDMHSHLIPAIDDGVKTIEESLEILRTMQMLGYEKIIITPHVMIHKYPNSTQSILNGLSILQKAAKEAKLTLTLEAAAEYYLDQEFCSRLHSNDILTIGDRHLLFEISHVSIPLNFDTMIYEIEIKNFTPILAHPERYRHIYNPQKTFHKMKDQGILFQVDINSLEGYYGKHAQKHAQLLAKWGMIDFLGSDIHHSKQLQSLSTIIATPTYQKILNTNPIKNNIL